jgi:hypothetical protein
MVLKQRKIKSKTSKKNKIMKSIVLVIATVSLIVSGCSSSTNYSGKPYKDSEYTAGMQVIPGRVYCAYYDLGGEGVAYHDTTEENLGSGRYNPLNGTYLHAFRMDEGVDISYTKNDIDNSEFNLVQPPMNVLYIGWTEPGEWTKYTVMVQKTGRYRVGMMHTSYRGGIISISVDDEDVTGPLDITPTRQREDPVNMRHWHHWNRMDNITEITLKKGKRILTLHTIEGGQNYMWLDFEPVN